MRRLMATIVTPELLDWPPNSECFLNVLLYLVKTVFAIFLLVAQSVGQKFSECMNAELQQCLRAAVPVINLCAFDAMLKLKQRELPALYGIVLSLSPSSIEHKTYGSNSITSVSICDVR